MRRYNECRIALELIVCFLFLNEVLLTAWILSKIYSIYVGIGINFQSIQRRQNLLPRTYARMHHYAGDTNIRNKFRNVLILKLAALCRLSVSLFYLRKTIERKLP